MGFVSSSQIRNNSYKNYNPLIAACVLASVRSPDGIRATLDGGGADGRYPRPVRKLLYIPTPRLIHLPQPEKSARTHFGT